jgi:hypothetical protein
LRKGTTKGGGKLTVGRQHAAGIRGDVGADGFADEAIPARVHFNTEGVRSPSMFDGKIAEDSVEVVGVVTDLDVRGSKVGAEKLKEGAEGRRLELYYVFGEIGEDRAAEFFEKGSKSAGRKVNAKQTLREPVGCGNERKNVGKERETNRT